MCRLWFRGLGMGCASGEGAMYGYGVVGLILTILVIFVLLRVLGLV